MVKLTLLLNITNMSLFDECYLHLLLKELKSINYKQPQKTNNMTKVTIIGEPASTVKKYTHIKFIKSLISGYKFETFSMRNWSKPSAWDNIELICRNYAEGMDLMFAYDDSRKDGILYVGYFNEGLV